MKKYTEIIKSVLESIALSEATMHEDLQTPERRTEMRNKINSAIGAGTYHTSPADQRASETNDDEQSFTTRLYGKGGKVIEKFKPKFFKGLDKIGQEIWSIGPKYYIVCWTHDIYQPRTKETTLTTEVWNSNKTGKVNYGGDPIFYLNGWHSGKAIMAALVEAEKAEF